MNKATVKITHSSEVWYLDIGNFLYAKSDRNYTDVHMKDGRWNPYVIPISKLMKQIEDVCSAEVSSIRMVGRSHIINIECIESIIVACGEVRLNDAQKTTLKCSKAALKELQEQIERKRLSNVLMPTKVQYTINAESYEDLCDKIITIDDVDCVDLGLPSGRLWAVENLEAPLGGIPFMFAWGETEPKRTCTNNNYKFGTDDAIKKYNQKDGLTKLLPEDDAATVILGEKWRTPSVEDFKELEEHCKLQWCTWDIHRGCLITGPNGNSIFMPAGGWTTEAMGVDAGNVGSYWTANREEEESYAIMYSFRENYDEEDSVLIYDGSDSRYFGLYIRPVADKK